MKSPVHVLIDTAVASRNCEVLSRAAGRRKLFAVVKADGYGHGMVPIAKEIVKKSVDGLCVFEMHDGESLRSADIRVPILVMGGFQSTEELARIVAADLWAVVHRPEQVAILESAPQTPSRVFLKVQTGMNRLGVAVDDVQELLDRLRECCGDLALMHHFADADKEGGRDRQVRVMRDVAASAGLPFTSSNSAGTLLGEDEGEEFVRCGISVYGCSPAASHSAADLGLHPVMSFVTEVISLQQLKQGDTVGYGSRWRAKRDTRIAVLACGYSHGYPRLAPDGTPVAAGDGLLPLAGRVSMEMLTVEDEHSRLKLGDEVQLWGDKISADEIAAAAGTISYELLAGMPANTERRIA